MVKMKHNHTIEISDLNGNSVVTQELAGSYGTNEINGEKYYSNKTLLMRVNLFSNIGSPDKWFEVIDKSTESMKCDKYTDLVLAINKYNTIEPSLKKSIDN